MNIFEMLKKKTDRIYWQKHLPFKISQIPKFTDVELVEEGIIKIEVNNVYEKAISKIQIPEVKTGKDLFKLCMVETSYNAYIKLFARRGMMFNPLVGLSSAMEYVRGQRADMIWFDADYF